MRLAVPKVAAGRWGRSSYQLFVLGPDDNAVAPFALGCLTAFQMLHWGRVLPVFLAALGALPSPLVVGGNASSGENGKDHQQELVTVDSHRRLLRGGCFPRDHIFHSHSHRDADRYPVAAGHRLDS